MGARSEIREHGRLTTRSRQERLRYGTHESEKIRAHTRHHQSGIQVCGGWTGRPHELARVLRQIADDVEHVDDEKLLRSRVVKDRDGEGIGTYRVMFQ